MFLLWTNKNKSLVDAIVKYFYRSVASTASVSPLCSSFDFYPKLAFSATRALALLGFGIA